MALKNEFDNKSYWIVLVRAVTGALLGTIPGIIYVVMNRHAITVDPFGIGLIQIGVVTGALVFGLAATSGVVVAALKNRASGTMKASKLKEYLQPDPLPTIPPPSRNPEAEKSEVKQPALATAPVPTVVPAPPAAVQPEQPVFEDYDR